MERICSYNMRNTRCYEFECVNYGRDILLEFWFDKINYIYIMNQEHVYREKYLKYKTKYLELKKNMTIKI